MSLAYDIVGVVLGVLGVFGVFQTLWSFVHYNLPAQRLKILDEILSDTAGLFQSVVEEGLVPDLRFAEATERKLLR